MRVGAVIQARMGSERLPGKVLHRVAGKPLLQYLLERVRRCGCLDGVVVATSAEEADGPVAAFCREQGVPCQRGPLADVARRFRDVLDRHPWDGFVRLSGDNPLLDPGLIERAVGLFRQGSEVDLVTNVLVRTYPPGQSVEVVRSATFRRAYTLMREPDDFEHVTRFFYKNRDLFRVVDFTSGRDHRGVHLAIDTPGHLNTFAAIVGRMARPHWDYGLDEVLGIYHELQGDRGERHGP
jgi:spore coat polysaccharide biosynthesis protein SpsF (cytidylyltransferase family)